jgi:hypothetical protein
LGRATIEIDEPSEQPFNSRLAADSIAKAASGILQDNDD